MQNRIIFALFYTKKIEKLSFQKPFSQFSCQIKVAHNQKVQNRNIFRIFLPTKNINKFFIFQAKKIYKIVISWISRLHFLCFFVLWYTVYYVNFQEIIQSYLIWFFRCTVFDARFSLLSHVRLFLFWYVKVKTRSRLAPLHSGVRLKLTPRQRASDNSASLRELSRPIRMQMLLRL